MVEWSFFVHPIPLIDFQVYLCDTVLFFVCFDGSSVCWVYISVKLYNL